jgi:hypothetical protein
MTDEARFRRCADVAWDRVCGALGVTEARQAARHCRDELSAADGALARAENPPDGMPALAVASLRQRIASEAFRLSSLHRVLALHGCADAADETADLTLLDGGRSVLVEPDRGLAPGTAYALRDRAGTALRATRTGAQLPDWRELDAARALAKRLDDAAGAVTTWPALPALTVTLPAPAETAPFWPPPIRVTRANAGEASSFVTMAAPVQRGEPSPACPSSTELADDVLAALAGGRAIGSVRRGALPAAPGAGRPEAVPFLLALPRQQPRGVVLLLHSLNAGARVILASLAGRARRAQAGRASRSICPDTASGTPVRRSFSSPPIRRASPCTRRRRDARYSRWSRRCGAARRRWGFQRTWRSSTSVWWATRSARRSGSSSSPSTPTSLRGPDRARRRRVPVAAPAGGPPRGVSCARVHRRGERPGLRRRRRMRRGPSLRPPSRNLALQPSVAPAYRLLIADVEPLAGAALLRPPQDVRPLLVQGALDDVIVFSTITRRVGDALDLPEVAAGEELPRRARRMWPGGHNFLDEAPVRAEAAGFLARYWDAPLR